MFRSFIVTTAAAITLSASTLSPTTATAGISTLGDCYNAVVTWCNEKHPSNASECAGGKGGGFDQCDEQFSKRSQNTAPFRLKALKDTDRPHSRPEGKRKPDSRKPSRSGGRPTRG